MGCNCSKKTAANYSVTRPDGTVERGLTQVDAAALARRTGGSYRLDSK